jgi:TorA maturation chaperone TorD/Pyruvate/2-oxoacid:ferredoxin oxidoreductase delta subunit
MDTDTARQRSRTYADLAQAFSKAEPGLEQEFTRLFLGPGRPVAHLYESVYREGRLMGETALDVSRRLAAENLAPDGRTLPDHVGIELAFMAHMAAREALNWEAGDAEAARGQLARQGTFLRDHLLAWLPQLCRRVMAGRVHEHYAQLAGRAEAFVRSDAACIRSWLGNGEDAVPDMDRQEWWSVRVAQGCTLCDICVQVCRSGALQQIRGEDTVSLHFDAVLCDGCAACRRWCPEGLIDVARLSPGQEPSSAELARSALLACPRCGRFHAPKAMVAKVQAQLGPGEAALSQRLALCHDCKVVGTPLRSRNTMQGDPSQPSAGGDALSGAPLSVYRRRG